MRMLKKVEQAALLLLPLVLCAMRVTAQEKPLPASGEPPEIQQLRRMERERPAIAHSSSVKEILDALRRQPGGAAMIERARRGGAHIPREGAMNFEPGNSQRMAFFASRETVNPVDEYQP